MPIYLVDNNGAPINTYEITIDSSHTIQTLLTSSPSQVDSWLLQTQSQSPLLVGLDIEWRPNSQRGQSNPAATLQLCTNNRCLVFQIIHSPSIPTSLLTFLANPNNRFVGVGIEADVEKLIEDYGMSVRNFVDLRNLAAEVLDDRDLLRSGIKSLGERVLGKIIEKPQRITRSRWDNPRLNADQSTAHISKVTEERNSAIEQQRRLQQELELLRRQVSRSRGGISITYVLLVAVIGFILGYFLKRT